MRTDTLAVVFTDIKGYTAATSSQTHQENARMLRRVERVVTPVVHGYNGHVIKSLGDAYMIVFRSPTEAVRCATAIQDRLHQHNTNTTADKAIHIRIAMNFGEVRVHRGDVFGEPVNIAARLEGVTPADEVYLSEAVYLTMNRSDIPTEPVGEFELKGIPEPVMAYRVKKFAHLAEGEARDDDGEERGALGVAAAGLPYAGQNLAQWRRLRWLRRVNQAMWLLVFGGVAGAAYLRYRPSSDYSSLLVQAHDAAQRNAPMEILAAAGQIPQDAIAERSEVRRYRRRAVELLIAAGDVETASGEAAALLAEDERDPEALVLRGLLSHRANRFAAAVRDIALALELDSALASRKDVIQSIVDGYRDPNARKTAERVVETIIKADAVPILAEAVENEGFGDRASRLAVAASMQKLGAGQEVDWVLLWVEDLKSSSCKARKEAISKLAAERDDRAVGPLMKIAETKGCGAAQAKAAAEEIVK